MPTEDPAGPGPMRDGPGGAGRREAIEALRRSIRHEMRPVARRVVAADDAALARWRGVEAALGRAYDRLLRAAAWPEADWSRPPEPVMRAAAARRAVAEVARALEAELIRAGSAGRHAEDDAT